MKKVFIGIGIILFIIVIGIIILPQVLFAFPFTQKWALKMEGEQVAQFYFKIRKKTPCI